VFSGGIALKTFAGVIRALETVLTAWLAQIQTIDLVVTNRASHLLGAMAARVEHVVGAVALLTPLRVSVTLALGAVSSVGGTLGAALGALVALTVALLQVGTNRTLLEWNALGTVVVVIVGARALIPVVADDVVRGALGAIAGVVIAHIALVRARSAPRATPVLVTLAHVALAVVVEGALRALTGAGAAQLAALLALGALTSAVLACLAVILALVAPAVGGVLALAAFLIGRRVLGQAHKAWAVPTGETLAGTVEGSEAILANVTLPPLAALGTLPAAVSALLAPGVVVLASGAGTWAGAVTLEVAHWAQALTGALNFHFVVDALLALATARALQAAGLAWTARAPPVVVVISVTALISLLGKIAGLLWLKIGCLRVSVWLLQPAVFGLLAQVSAAFTTSSEVVLRLRLHIEDAINLLLGHEGELVVPEGVWFVQAIMAVNNIISVLPIVLTPLELSLVMELKTNIADKRQKLNLLLVGKLVGDEEVLPLHANRILGNDCGCRY